LEGHAASFSGAGEGHMQQPVKIHHPTPLLSPISLPASLHGVYPLFYSLPISMPPFPAPFTSPRRWRWHSPLKRWYPATLFHGIIIQKTQT